MIPPPGPRLVVVTAVGPETRAVLAVLRAVRRVGGVGFRVWHGEIEGRPVRLVQSGVGPVRAMQALGAIPAPHGLVLSVGFAGGLSANTVTGDVVLPTNVLWGDAGGTQHYAVPTVPWRLAKAGLDAAVSQRILEGSLFSSAQVIASTDDKRALALRTGAVAVEMEAAGLIPLACRRGPGLLALRVILDTADVSLEGLPPDLDSSWRARAKLLRHPRAWASVWSVARHVPAASRSLTQALASVLPAL